ncbi:MAG TPA: methylated-DNA--[protein]-cysteine S-methyltransferase [Rhizomicrobium sp.]|nr:methylated-DNA--[protein]-cysteine S-methyltransferase [Rhizomicrobium sp.]
MILEDPEAGSAYRSMGRAIRYLAENYASQPSLDDVASAVGLSPFHFQRLFTRYVGVSPKNFVGHLTLGRAKAELASGASVLDAALEAGLSGPSRLHDLCLKIEAMTPGDYAKGGAGLVIDYGFHDCPFGVALAMATDKGLCGLAFGDEGEEAEMLADMRARWPHAAYRERPACTRAMTAQIFDPEHGGEMRLHLIGTPWQIKVWQALLAIPSGKVVTYRTIAEKVSDAKSSRAVGTAVGRNPISWLIPCHRVLGSDGALHGYHWGLPRKRAMLAVEAARVAA